MVRNVTISVLLHGVLLGLAYFGLPLFTDVPLQRDVPISVEVLTVAQKTNIPTKPKEPVPKVKPAPTPPPKPPAPPPAPRGSLKEPPKPDLVAELPKEKAAVALQEDVKPKKKPRPKAKSKRSPKKSAMKKHLPAPFPPRKPKAPDRFASVLKTLEELKQEPQKKLEKKKKEVRKQAPDFTKLMANALKSERQRTDIGPEVTISEIDLVRQQIQKCWNLPAGAKDAQNMQISIRIGMNPDGTVRTARILNGARMSSDPFYRTMAESAQRAVLNPMCQPFKLPPEKYESWRSMKINFDPRDMFGL